MNTATATALPIDQATAAPPPGSLREDAMVISLVGLAHASSHFSHLLLPALFPVFMKAFGLNFAELGLLSTVFFFISGTGQALAGWAKDLSVALPGTAPAP